MTQTSVEPVRVAVLLSGSGSTLQNLIDRSRAGQLPAEVVAVVSSRPGVKGLERAEAAGIPAHCVPRRQYDSAQAHSDAIMDWLADYQPGLIVLAGYLSLFLPGEQWQGRVMNIHPALIPAFCGKGYWGHHVHEAVWQSGVKVTGATVHFVDDEYDHGPIILQETVPVFDNDTPDTIAGRVQELERTLYPQAITLFAAGRLTIAGQRVLIDR